MKNFCILVALLLISNGCNHYYYVPNNVAIPAIYDRYDATVSLAMSRFRGWEAQAAFSPFRHTVLMYNYMGYRHQLFSGSEWAKGHLHEGGAGAYFSRKPFSCHLIGGFGGGKVENGYSLEELSLTADSRLDFRRWFLQPGFVLQTEHFRLGMAFRQIWLEYYEGSVNIEKTPAEELILIQEIEQAKPFKFAELGISAGVRIKPVRISFTSTWRPGDDTYLDRINLASSNYNLMFTFELHEFWRKKEPLTNK